MRCFVLLVLLLVCVHASAQQGYVNIGVVPSPQRVEMGSGTLANLRATPQRVFVERIEGAQNQMQAYRLVVSEQGVQIFCVGNEGWGYALKTLDQLRRLYPGGIPCMTVTDWPAYEFRGWLDDISRGPIPNRQFRRMTRSFSDLILATIIPSIRSITSSIPTFRAIAASVLSSIPTTLS